MAFANLTTTSTFNQWYVLTNQIGTFLNNQVFANGQVALGAFTLDPTGNINLCNTFYANSVGVVVNGSFSFAGGNTAFLGNNFSVAANTIVLNPITSVLVNTALTVNAVAAFLANISAINIASSGTINAPTIRADGNLIANNGTLIARQLSFTTNGASVNSSLSAAGYADYSTTGIEDAGVWYANPTQNTVVSGLQGHTAVTSSTDGSRILFLQNVSATSKITLSPANTSSTDVHRFTAPGNVDVLPGTTVLLIYSKTTQRWEVVGGASSGTTGTFSDLSITGNLTVGGIATFSANLVAIPLYVNQVTGRVGIGTATPSQQLDVTGNALFEGVTTANDLRATKLSATSNVAFANVAFYANGVTVFTNFITVNGTDQSLIQNLRAGQFLCDTSITGNSVSAVSGAFSGAVTANTLTANLITGNVVTANIGTFGTLGVMVASNAVFSRIGVGAAVDASAVALFSGQYYSPLVGAGNSGATKTLDWNSGNEQYVTMTGNCTFTLSNPVNGGRYVILLNTGAGSFTATWPATVRWSGGSAPVLTTAAGKLDLFTFIWNSTLGLYFGASSPNYSAS